MSIVDQKMEITPEAFLVHPDRKSLELVDGELREKPVSVLSSWVGGEIFGRIREFCQAHRLGWVFPADVGIQCFPDRPLNVRKPDVTFVKAARFSPEQIGDGWLRVVPDLVVEVISPNDLVSELDEKLEMFREVGVPLIWVFNPSTRTVRILRADGSGIVLREGDILSGDDILPGFACPLASFFPPRA